MTADSALHHTLDIFRSRLETLRHLMGRARTDWAGDDPGRFEQLMAARIHEDMLPFPHQVAFTCNQPGLFVAWLRDAEYTRVDPTTLSFEELDQHVEETIAQLTRAAAEVAPERLERDKFIELPQGMGFTLPGPLYVDEWLMPNFYFHLVTAYDLMRAQGVQIGKADYMRHLAPRVGRG